MMQPSHLHKALVCAMDFISKDVQQHFTVTVGLQVPAAEASAHTTGGTGFSHSRHVTGRGLC
jgi:hypothetical protein